jgi:hypothetical protein
LTGASSIQRGLNSGIKRISISSKVHTTGRAGRGGVTFDTFKQNGNHSID